MICCQVPNIAICSRLLSILYPIFLLNPFAYWEKNITFACENRNQADYEHLILPKETNEDKLWLIAIILAICAASAILYAFLSSYQDRKQDGILYDEGC